MLKRINQMNLHRTDYLDELRPQAIQLIGEHNAIFAKLKSTNNPHDLKENHCSGRSGLEYPLYRLDPTTGYNMRNLKAVEVEQTGFVEDATAEVELGSRAKWSLMNKEGLNKSEAKRRKRHKEREALTSVFWDALSLILLSLLLFCLI